MMYVSQIIMLYALNLYRAVCQKAERKKLFRIFFFTVFTVSNCKRGGFPYQTILRGPTVQFSSETRVSADPTG